LQQGVHYPAVVLAQAHTQMYLQRKESMRATSTTCKCQQLTEPTASPEAKTSQQVQSPSLLFNNHSDPQYQVVGLCQMSLLLHVQDIVFSILLQQQHQKPYIVL
jgi:hypothetical protein